MVGLTPCRLPPLLPLLATIIILYVVFYFRIFSSAFNYSFSLSYVPWARTACSSRSAQAATLLEFLYHSRIVLSVGGSVWYVIRSETSVAQSQLTQF